MTYPQVNPKQSFPEIEAKILAFWKENKTFLKSLEIRKDSEEFVFFDGPPFVTGLPHYWHLLWWTLKDVIPRYQTMKWKYVERRFGWDCHGLPIENIVEKKLGISGKRDIEDKIWVFEFNEECNRSAIANTQAWRIAVEKMWRWVDMDNDYKTMDTSFMESVWWVFKSLFDKWYIYESQRVVPYCPRCSTPLSNFEVNQWYEDKQDKSITVKFKVKGSENKYILAWTTTPWTLPANLWLAVGKDIEYAEVLDNKSKETYVLAKDRLGSYYKNEEDYTILRVYKWDCLVWIKYEPIFNDFSLLDDSGTMPKWLELGKNVYSVILWHHVTTESGTWVVHIAPAYWEDDSQIWKKENLWFVSHIDDTWKVENLYENLWEYVFDFNETVIKKLKERGDIISITTIDHSYPHCYRCHTPLIYRWISAWYVKVEEISDRLVKNNEEINWVPENIKHWRFWKWIENARDWNISRNRYWWSAMPIWRSEDKTQIYCVWSIDELYELNKDFWQIEKRGEKYYYTESNIEIDLHKHYVDKIKIKHPTTWSELTRIPEVLDCWFESGSMPYASKHYPFSKENFKYPWDFIAEWQDQTRWWFYTLLILWTILFDRTPFLNVIVNWMVLAEDGKKMSKSLSNYPDPIGLINKHWADSIRFYMMNSGWVRSDDLKFSETWVEETVKKVILPFWNTYSFFTTYANIDNFEWKEEEIYKHLSDPNFNKLDLWILSKLQELIKDVDSSFEAYDINWVTRPIFDFMDNLTNWYIRRSRRRFWKSENDNDKLFAYNTLYEVLVQLSKIIAPVMPFISEEVYKNLTNKESVHLELFPEYKKELFDEELNILMDKTQKIINLWLALRSNKKIRVRQPLESVTIWEKLNDYYLDIIKEELNVKNVEVVNYSEIAKLKFKENAKEIAKNSDKKMFMKEIIENLKSWKYIHDWGFIVEMFIESANKNIKLMVPYEIDIYYESFEEDKWDIIADWWFVIKMNTELSEKLLLEWYARDLVRIIQDTRKEAWYNVSDRIKLDLRWDNSLDILESFKDYIESETLSTIEPNMSLCDVDKEVGIDEFKYTI
ncbi:MAG: hypothetical protein ACD_4C00256G0001, partial [uncultured bacterium (gcode 4)]